MKSAGQEGKDSELLYGDFKEAAHAGIPGKGCARLHENFYYFVPDFLHLLNIALDRSLISNVM